MAELAVRALLSLLLFYRAVWREQKESLSSMCVGLGRPRLPGTRVFVCVRTQKPHRRRNMVLVLAAGVFSLEPKAQPSANIRETQGQQD